MALPPWSLYHVHTYGWGLRTLRRSVEQFSSLNVTYGRRAGSGVVQTAFHTLQIYFSVEQSCCQGDSVNTGPDAVAKQRPHGLMVGGRDALHGIVRKASDRRRRVRDFSPRRYIGASPMDRRYRKWLELVQDAISVCRCPLFAGRVESLRTRIVLKKVGK